MYRSEVETLFEGSQLRSIDQRRYMLEQAINIAGATLSKNPKSAVKKAAKSMDKQEKKIDKHEQNDVSHPNPQQYVNLMNQWNNSFKRKEEDNG